VGNERGGWVGGLGGEKQASEERGDRKRCGLGEGSGGIVRLHVGRPVVSSTKKEMDLW